MSGGGRRPRKNTVERLICPSLSIIFPACFFIFPHVSLMLFDIRQSSFHVATQTTNAQQNNNIFTNSNKTATVTEQTRKHNINHSCIALFVLIYYPGHMHNFKFNFSSHVVISTFHFLLPTLHSNCTFQFALFTSIFTGCYDIHPLLLLSTSCFVCHFAP